MDKRLILILGGAKSGKSDFAQALAQKRGGPQVLFVATAQARDEEMRQRIECHRATRPTSWTTLEATKALGRELRSGPQFPIVLIDCVTLWTSNVMAIDDSTAAQSMQLEVDELLAWYRSAQSELILVSDEVGMGLVPDNNLGRAYRDLLGSVNRKLASSADQVFMLVAGLAIELKSQAVPWAEV